MKKTIELDPSMQSDSWLNILELEIERDNNTQYLMMHPELFSMIEQSNRNKDKGLVKPHDRAPLTTEIKLCGCSNCIGAQLINGLGIPYTLGYFEAEQKKPIIKAANLGMGEILMVGHA